MLLTFRGTLSLLVTMRWQFNRCCLEDEGFFSFPLKNISAVTVFQVLRPQILPPQGYGSIDHKHVLWD